MSRLQALVAAGVLGGAVVLSLGETAPATQPGSELAQLREENARLRKELAELKAKSAEGAPAAATAGPATRPVVRKFSTMAEILTKVPAELQPKATAEWRKFTANKLEDWWREQLVGMTFEQTMAVGSCYVGRNYINAGPGAEWLVEIYFDSKPFVAFGATRHMSIGKYMIAVDEAAAKEWNKLKKGALLRVKGAISGAGIAARDYPRGCDVELRLSDMEVSRP